MCMTTQYDYFRRASLIHLVRLFQVDVFWGYPVLFKRFLCFSPLSPPPPAPFPFLRLLGRLLGRSGDTD